MAILPQQFAEVPVGDITPHPQNTRLGDVEVIAESIEANGFFGACVVQRSSGHILVGNHRWLAACKSGQDKVPVLWLDVDDDTACRIMLADNRTAELASWDNHALLSALEDLSATADGLAGTGFTDADFENLLARFGQPPSLDDLVEQHGTPDARVLWPVLRVAVPPEVMTRWKAWRAKVATDDDAVAFVALLDAVAGMAAA